MLVAWSQQAARALGLRMVAAAVMLPRHCGILLLVASGGSALYSQQPTDREVSVSTVPSPPTTTSNPFYVSSRPPLRPTPLIPLPMRSIRPHGWLLKQLELQAAGFFGHLGEISRFLKKEGNAWLHPQGEGDHGWEEVPYWLKGYLLNAYILRDPEMMREANFWIEGALRSQRADGWFGPRQARSTVSSTEGKYDLWPNMVMLFCLQSYYEFTDDARVLELMTDYFRWQLSVPESEFLPPFWQQQRAADNLFSVYWLYNRTGEPWLLQLAEKIHRHTAPWTDGIANWHNVNFAQAFGGPTTFFLQSGEEQHLRAAYRNYDEMRTLYGRVPGGMYGSDENCRPGFHDPRQAVETCGMVEMMLSLETLVQITGDLLWADRCEDVAFNSLPAALTADFKALRYLTAPNMPLSDKADKSPGVQNGGPMFWMNPHLHRCCQHNFGHGWPYYALHLWFATPDQGLAAVLYGPSQVTARVAGDTEVTLEQSTHYPFSDQVQFTVRTRREAAFPLYFRIPGWCNDMQMSINGERMEVEALPRQFVRVARQWRDGDQVLLTLPMQIRLRTWRQNQNSVSVDRGPLTYALKIGERYVPEGGTEAWPAWEIHPTTPWNYGLVLKAERPAESFRVAQHAWPASDMPFTAEEVPVHLVAQAQRIPGWQLDERGLVGRLQPSPVRSDAPIEEVRLIPMGAARLRISAFPVMGEGPEAKPWPTDADAGQP